MTARPAVPPSDVRPPGPYGGAVSPRLVEAVRARLARAGVEPSAANVAMALRAENAVLGDAEVLTVARALCADLIGAGPLEPLLAQPDVTDVLVNGPGEVWVDDGDGLRRTSVTFPDEESLRRLAQRLAASAGRRLDDASPYVDARLPGGVRLHALLPPLAPGGTCVSLRLPPRRTFTLDDLVASGTIPPGAAGILPAVIAARLAFLVTGGTGTGKTTLLSALLSLADPRERLLLVEDAAELRPVHPHVVRLESRPPNLEGVGGVGLRDLVRQALRMRPDRLVVGEVRGKEVVELLAALNTGHEGGCGTLHANTAADVPPRLEALACAAGLGREAVHSQIAAALDLIIHLVRDPGGGRRRIAELSLLVRRPSGLVEAEPALTFTPDGRTVAGPAHSILIERLSPDRRGTAGATCMITADARAGAAGRPVGEAAGPSGGAAVSPGPGGAPASATVGASGSGSNSTAVTRSFARTATPSAVREPVPPSGRVAVSRGRRGITPPARRTAMAEGRNGPPAFPKEWS
ncbi:pilus assembly protein CpaF [Thermostaphylospora chromogena]|uniref:Pilus assembly protein CpaF n=1 Tax=Thermostaphylospora chromogena TaxID=35622 RepID=A0A1H1DC02_9ACTN|nr:pilus assembly protein CpaF [Thermostaphylospora chromogena]